MIKGSASANLTNIGHWWRILRRARQLRLPPPRPVRMTLPTPDAAFHWSDEPWGPALRCRPLAAHAQHLFTSRQLALPDPEAWRAALASAGSTPDRLMRVKQVHGNTVRVLKRGHVPPDAASQRPDADAIVSNETGAALAVMVADCVPVLLCDPSRGAAAAIHAGWRGTCARVVDAAVDSLRREFGCDPADLIAAIGPSIGPGDYQVGDSVLEAFRAAGHPESDMQQWFVRSGGRLRLDLWAANSHQLIESGVDAGRIFCCGLSTVSHPGVFDSYRIDGERAGRMAGIIVVPRPTAANARRRTPEEDACARIASAMRPKALLAAIVSAALGCAAPLTGGSGSISGRAVDYAPVNATLDADERQTSPVPHRYLHGVIPDDARFQLAIPDNWNGKLVIFSRGFSGTELTTGAFKTIALEKGYAFAASDEGWNRVTIAREPEDTYYESHRRLRELTVYAQHTLGLLKGQGPQRTLMVGGSNGGHHTKWMLEDLPDLFDGGIAGYGFNSQVSQWGSIATVLRNYAAIADRIDDIIARRKSDPQWDPQRSPLSPPLTSVQLASLQRIYRIPATLADGFTYDVGRWPGSEDRWKSGHDALVGYLHDSMPRFDPSFNPDGGALTDAELPYWDPAKSPRRVLNELRRLDLTGRLQRPAVIMHGTADQIVSPGETSGYQALVTRRLGEQAAREMLAVYFIAGMGHGGVEFDRVLGEQFDVLERWIDYRQSGGKRGALPPDALGGYARNVR